MAHRRRKTGHALDQIGFAIAIRLVHISLRFVNFGFNYHKSKNFNRLFSMEEYWITVLAELAIGGTDDYRNGKE